MFTFAPGETQKQMTLAYPAIQPRPDKYHYGIFSALTSSQSPAITVTWILTDGVYEFTGSLELPDPGTLASLHITADIPIDWQTENTTLQIIADAAEQVQEHTFYSDRYSLLYRAGPQHLPLLGIG